MYFTLYLLTTYTYYILYLLVQLTYLGPQWQTTTAVYESDSLSLLCAFEGGTGVVQISLSGGEVIVVGTQLPVSEATDGSCLPNNSMVVEWATTNLTLRRQMNAAYITCNASNSCGYPKSLSMSTELDVQCKFTIKIHTMIT